MEKTQYQMFYAAERKLAEETEVFLEMCNPKHGDAMTLAEFNACAKRCPEKWEKFRRYAEKNLD